ncbi:MAG: 5'-methylthioadenosine/adenosylhomocysteine nucleosidase [Candidatus Dactylopiibacterium sp.]|nr:5'-methylthioadenosine/adenosylhomocysteine nucleosidase [Candidatus Dactylopiibacterium sp.]
MIALLGAMDVEIDGFLSCLALTGTHRWNGLELHRGTLDGHDVLISRSGVGKVMAAMVTQYLIDRWAPRAVIFTGIAGSLRADVDIGDTLVAADLVQHDMDAAGLGVPRGQIPFTPHRYIAAHPTLLAIARDYAPATGRLHVGRVCTGDQFITHRELGSHAYLTDELAGDAVEMEGAAVALVCALNGVPGLVVRTVSDRADGNAAVNFESFLPQAGANSLHFVRHLLARLPAGPL